MNAALLPSRTGVYEAAATTNPTVASNAVERTVTPMCTG